MDMGMKSHGLLLYEIFPQKQVHFEIDVLCA